MASGVFPASPSPGLRDNLSIGLNWRGALINGPEGRWVHTHTTPPRHNLFTCCLIRRLPQQTRGPRAGRQPPQGLAEPTCIATVHCLQGNSPEQAPT